MKKELQNDSSIDMQLARAKASVIDDAKRIIRIVGTTDDEDRYGDVVDPKGGDLRNYKKNPVFLWAHDHSIPPIGRSVKETTTDSGIYFDIQFAHGPFASEIYNLYKEGFMSASSIGFISLESEPRDTKKYDAGYGSGLTHTKWELLELSAVPIPANPEALVSPNDPPKKEVSEKITTEKAQENARVLVRSLTMGGRSIPALTKWANENEKKSLKDTVPIELMEGHILAHTVIDVETKAEAWKVCGSRSLGLDESDSWDKGAAQASLGDDLGLWAKAHVLCEGDGTKKGDFHLPFAQKEGGELKAVKAGIQACAGGHGINAIGGVPDNVKSSGASFIAAYYKMFKMDPPDSLKEFGSNDYSNSLSDIMDVLNSLSQKIDSYEEKLMKTENNTPVPVVEIIATETKENTEPTVTINITVSGTDMVQKAGSKMANSDAMCIKSACALVGGVLKDEEAAPSPVPATYGYDKALKQSHKHKLMGAHAILSGLIPTGTNAAALPTTSSDAPVPSATGGSNDCGIIQGFSKASAGTKVKLAAAHSLIKSVVNPGDDPVDADDQGSSTMPDGTNPNFAQDVDPPVPDTVKPPDVGGVPQVSVIATPPWWGEGSYEGLEVRGLKPVHAAHLQGAMALIEKVMSGTTVADGTNPNFAQDVNPPVPDTVKPPDVGGDPATSTIATPPWWGEGSYIEISEDNPLFKHLESEESLTEEDADDIEIPDYLLKYIS